jgi:hypothetical protein
MNGFRDLSVDEMRQVTGGGFFGWVGRKVKSAGRALGGLLKKPLFWAGAAVVVGAAAVFGGGGLPSQN